MSTPYSTPSSPIPPASQPTVASASAPNCPRCARPIPANTVLGACPHCLLAAGLTSEPAAPSSSAPPPSPAELAPEFPQLEILELLGRGGMGAVYKARQKSLDRFVALKLLRPGLDADPSFAERFTREARALAQLNHPGIVTLYEFGRTPGGLFFILMEFVDGLNLRQLLAAGRLSPREALAIVPPLCDALQYAHDRGLIHRDIKPENILIDRLGRVKIADFGLAKLTTNSTAQAASLSANDTNVSPTLASDTGHCSPVIGHSADGASAVGAVFGTPGYMAPEQRERPHAVDHRADIYALGVVLYQMLTGELPDAKQLQPPSHRVHLDIRLDAIVLRALEANPSLRYAAASEFKTQFETVASSPLSPPTPPGAPTSPSAFSASSSVPDSPAAFPPAPSAPPLFRVSAIFSRHRLKFWLLRVAPLSLLVMLALRFFVIAPYRLKGSSVEPYIPAGSLAFVYKLKRHFSPGDIIAYHHTESLTYVARVTQPGPVDNQLIVTRRNLPPTSIAASSVIGKVIFNTRNSPSPSGPPSINSSKLAINAVIPLSLAALVIWIWKLFKRSSIDGLPGRTPTLRPPDGAFVLLCTLHLAWVFSTADELPGTVASHFGMSGRADGYMSKNGYLAFICLFPFAFALVLHASILLGLRLPARLINLPHRDVWLAPARRLEFAAILRSWFASLSCAAAVFSIQIHTLTLLANRLQPRRLPDIALFVLLGFLFVFIVWIAGFLMRLAEPQSDPRLHRRRALTLMIVSVALLGFFSAPLVVEWNRPQEKQTSPVASKEPAELRDARAALADADVRYLDSHPKMQAAHNQVEVLERLSKEQPDLSPGLREATADLAEARTRYLDGHPIVRAIQNRITALEWLHQIDSGNYAQSWAAASPLFKKALTETTWIASLQSVRAPLGKVTSRHFESTQGIGQPLGSAGGPHLAFRFATRFENKPDAVETVTFTRDDDGVYRASGYYIK